MAMAMAYLADTIKQNSSKLSATQRANRLGVAKGKFDVPDDIDFCNDEIALLFGVN